MALQKQNEISDAVLQQLPLKRTILSNVWFKCRTLSILFFIPVTWTTQVRSTTPQSTLHPILMPSAIAWKDAWIDGESLGVDPGTLSDGVQVFEGLTELF